MYADDDLLLLSGLQHFAFCPRQWALTYIDQQWADNHLTLEGSWLHRRVDDPYAMERDGSNVVLRSVPVKSATLGLFGIADLLELYPQTEGGAAAFTVGRYPGRWRVVPVEYKHGRPKDGDADEVQLCAQAMCLEEMYHISIPHGAIYYGLTRRRTTVTLGDGLRQRVARLAEAMHGLMASGRMPDAKPERKCRSCSLRDICMADDLRHAPPVGEYLKTLSQ